MMAVAYFLVPEVLAVGLPIALASAGKLRPVDGLLPAVHIVAMWPLAVTMFTLAKWVGWFRVPDVIVVLFCLWFPVLMLTQLLKGLMLQQKMFGSAGVAYFLEVGVTSVLVVALYLGRSLSLDLSAIALLAPSGLAAIFGCWMLMSRAGIRMRFGDHWRRTLGFGVSYYPAKLCLLLFTFVPQLYVIGRFSNAKVGFFGVSLSIAAGGALLPSTLQQVAIPLVSASQGAPESAKQFTLLIRLTFLGGLVIECIYVGVGWLVVPSLLGAPFAASVWPGALLLAVSTIGGVGLVLEGGLAGLQRARGIFAARVVGVVVLGAGIGEFGTEGGLVGVSAITLVGAVAATLVLLLEVRRRFGVRLSALMPLLSFADLKEAMGIFGAGKGVG
jgi:O-antigen/teichoic acid export membrane protein